MGKPGVIPPFVRYVQSARRVRESSAPPAPATPTFSQLGTAVKGLAVDFIDVPFPATVVDDEVAIIIVSTVIVDVNSITDWDTASEIYQASQGGVDFMGGFAWQRLVAANGGGSLHITFAVPTNVVACVATFLGCNNSVVPFEDVQTLADTSATLTGSALTTTDVNRLVLCLGAVGRGNAVPTMSDGAAWTERMDTNGTGGGARCVINEKEFAAAGTTTVPTATITSDDWMTCSLALFG